MIRSRGVRLGWLVLLWVFAAGAAHQEGVVEARRWMHEGDLARAGRLWAVAYESYKRVAETFPGTPHGQLAARRVRWMQARMVRTDRSPHFDGDVTWLLEEMIDFVTWP